jgi:hypothetical protein
VAFQPGQSGNPGGRPKGQSEVVRLAQKHGKAAIRRLVELMSDEDSAVQVKACQAILDRGFGKPSQSIDLPSGVGLGLIRVEFVDKT